MPDDGLKPGHTFCERAFVGRVFGVTGGAKGIGAAIVAQLLHCGASVLAMDRDANALSVLASHHTSCADRLLCQLLDVADGASVEKAITLCTDHFGRIDGWVNNAMCNPGCPFEDSTEEQFYQAWQVNTLAAWRSAKLLLPHFKKNRRGSIVNVSSITAHQTTFEQAAYTSSKAGLEGLTRALAVELAEHHIRVNAVALGYVLTYSSLPPCDQWDDFSRLEAEVVREINTASAPWPQAAVAEDIAEPIVFLLSDASRMMTGTTLAVDGGLSVDLRPIGDPRRLGVGHKIAAIRRQISELAHG